MKNMMVSYDIYHFVIIHKDGFNKCKVRRSTERSGVLEEGSKVMSLKTMWMRRFDLMDTSVSQEKKVLYNSLMYKNNSLF
jgi:hypothetical protein